MSLTYVPGVPGPAYRPILDETGSPPVTLLTLTPNKPGINPSAPLDLTTALTASPLGSNTGVVFPNDLHTVLLVQLTAATTITSLIGTTIQGQTVPGVQASPSAAGIYWFSPLPSQFDRTDGTSDIEVDFGTPGSVSGVIAVSVPGVS